MKRSIWHKQVLNNLQIRVQNEKNILIAKSKHMLYVL